MEGADLLASAFNGPNSALLMEQYADWTFDPASVDPNYAAIFEAMDADARLVLDETFGKH